MNVDNTTTFKSYQTYTKKKNTGNITDVSFKAIYPVLLRNPPTFIQTCKWQLQTLFTFFYTKKFWIPETFGFLFFVGYMRSGRSRTHDLTIFRKSSSVYNK